MNKITTEHAMDKLYMFQSRFRRIDEFGWWDLESFSECTYTIYLNVKKKCQTHGVHFKILAPEHQEMNGQVEVTQRTLRKISHSLMVRKRIFILH